jgi:hypothetical protein
MAIDEGESRLYLEQKKNVSNVLFLSSLAVKIPAIAAALEDTDMLLSHVTSLTELLRQNSELFPNALNAVVASGMMEVLSAILDYMKMNVKGKPEANTWDEMRTAARGIG